MGSIRIKSLLAKAAWVLAFNLASLAISLGIGLGLTEAYLRFKYSRPDGHGIKLAKSPELGWDSVPSVSALGSATESSQGPLRLVFAGDSFTQSVYGRWPEFATGILEEHGRPIRGYNLGVSGFGTTQSLLKLERHFPELRPEIVVLLVHPWNDLRDNLNHPAVFYLPETRLRPYMDLGTSRIEGPKDAGYLLEAIRSTELFRRIYLPLKLDSNRELAESRGLDYIVERRLPVELHVHLRAAWLPFYLERESGSRYVRDAWSVTELALARMRDFLGAKGCRFFVIALDNPFTVDEDVFASAFAGIEGADRDLTLKRLAELMGRLGIAYADATPELRTLSKRTGKKLFKGEPGDIAGHLHTEGDEVVGAIAARLVSSALPPS